MILPKDSDEKNDDFKQEEKSDIAIKYNKAIEVLEKEYKKNGSINIKEANKNCGELVTNKTIIAYSDGRGGNPQKTTIEYILKVSAYVKNYTDSRRSIYKFIINELGQDKNTTKNLNKYVGSYKILHKFPIEIQQIDSLRITVSPEADIAGFGFPYSVNGQDLICKGYLFEKRNCIYLLDISADSIFFAKLSRTDHLDRNYLRGFAFLEQTDISMVCISPLIIHKYDAKLSSKQNSKIGEFLTESIESHINKHQQKK